MTARSIRKSIANTRLPIVFAVALGCAGFGSAQTPITFRYYYNDLNQLTRVVDSTRIVLQYV